MRFGKRYLALILVFKVSELAANIQDTLQAVYGRNLYWVVGEVSSLVHYPDKDRYYFDLVEKLPSATETARLKVNAWQSGSGRISRFTHETGQKLVDGLQILIQVSVSFHPVYGLSLTLADINTEFTLGNLALMKGETLRRLVAENPDAISLVEGEYQTTNKNAPLPLVIQRIAVIGSPNSEGFRDFTTVLTGNSTGYTFSLDTFYSSVQGRAAEMELVKALVEVYHQHKQRPYDVVVLIRGGGSKTDFLVFDTYTVARAAARFPVPLLTGIGHTGDHSITDKMVFQSLNTPTKVAEYILEHNRNFESALQWISTQIRTHATDRLIQEQEILRSSSAKVISEATNRFSRSARVLDRTIWNLGRSGVNSLSSREKMCARLHSSLELEVSKSLARKKWQVEAVLAPAHIRNRFGSLKSTLDHLALQIQLNDPQRLLERGYAMIFREEKIVRGAGEVSTGDPLIVRMKDGEFNVTVSSNGREPNL